MEYAIIAAIVLAVIRLLVKIFRKPPVDGEPTTMEQSFEEPAQEEASPTQVDAVVKELGCYVEMTGIHTPHTGQIFEAVFETDDRRILKFRIPQEMYEGLEKGLRGRLTYVEEDLYSFEPDEEDVS